MGKKKDKHRKRDGAHAHGGSGKGAFAGIAAMALHQVKQQLDTTAGRQMMATGLRAAADALAPKRAPEPPAPPRPPEAPRAPERSAFHGNPAEPPRDEAPPRPEVPPEVARVIGSVAAGLEKWAAKLGTPRT